MARSLLEVASLLRGALSMDKKVGWHGDHDHYDHAQTSPSVITVLGGRRADDGPCRQCSHILYMSHGKEGLLTTHDSHSHT